MSSGRARRSGPSPSYLPRHIQPLIFLKTTSSSKLDVQSEEDGDPPRPFRITACMKKDIEAMCKMRKGQAKSLGG